MDELFQSRLVECLAKAMVALHDDDHATAVFELRHAAELLHGAARGFEKQADELALAADIEEAVLAVRKGEPR